MSPDYLTRILRLERCLPSRPLDLRHVSTEDLRRLDHHFRVLLVRDRDAGVGPPLPSWMEEEIAESPVPLEDAILTDAEVERLMQSRPAGRTRLDTGRATRRLRKG